MPVRREPAGTFTPGRLCPHLFVPPVAVKTGLSGQLRGEKRAADKAQPTKPTR